jgi:hypothetical protein
MNNTSMFYLIWLKFWFQKKFEKEIVFENSVLAWIRSRIRIRIGIEPKCWIQISIESIRIHNPAGKDWPEPHTVELKQFYSRLQSSSESYENTV